MPCGVPSYPNAASHEAGVRSLVFDVLQEGADQSGLRETKSQMGQKFGAGEIRDSRRHG